jgi:peroxiredoxin Q/BCP
VSKDSVASHKKFKEKYSIPFVLLSDPEGNVCKQFGVMKEKSMFGKKYMGIERSTFVINERGDVVRAYRKVRVPGHVTHLLSELDD